MAPAPGFKKWLFLAAGTGCVGVGAIGIAVPVLPTTPSLLLAAFFYARSSQRFHDALLGNRLVGTYIRNYVERRGMTLRSKVGTLCLLWAGIILTAVFATDSPSVRTTLLVVAVAVSTHIVTLKTAEPVDRSGKR